MKKTAKKLISVLLCMVIIITTLVALSVPASGATTGLAGDSITWSYDSGSKTLTFAGTGEMYDYRASSIGGNKTAPWASYKSALTTIVVGEGITLLGEYAFYNCTALTSVSLPSTLKTISGWGTKTTSYGCFQGCTALASITLNDGLETVETCAFKGCSALQSIVFPNSVTSIGYGAFNDCTSLEYVSFGTGITETGSNAFYGCNGLKTINWGNVERISTNSFEGFFGASLEFPESVSYIGFRAFANNYNLRSVLINNADCEIITSNLTEQISPFAGRQQDITIYGHSGSTAQQLATTYNYTFISIDPCDHEETSDRVVLAPTCTAKGTTEKVCTNCGFVVKTVETDELGHDYQVVETNDLTEENGHIYTTEQCSRCNDIKNSIKHATTGEVSPRYVWVEGYYDYSNTATCTRPGLERYECKVEGCTMVGNIATQETISASLSGHKIDEWNITKQATCTEDGERKGTCSVCGEEQTEKINALGHIYSTEENSPDLVESVSPEESEDGHSYKIYKCQRCDTEIAISEHIEWLDGYYTSEVITEPGCVRDGIGRDTCDICSKTRLTVLPANGEHIWNETSRTEPTCTATGKIYYACEACSATRYENMEALGHDYCKDEESSVAPDCTNAGYDSEKCSRCPATRRVALPALGHSIDNESYMVVAEPTCVDKGRGVSLCTVCGESFDVEIPELGHNFEEVVLDLAPENKPGHSLVTPTCTRCGERQAGSIRHDEWMDGYFTKKDGVSSTCNVQGYDIDTCSICNITRRNALPVLGHIYNYVGDNEYTDDTLASMTYQGMLYRCTICQRSERLDANDVLNHWNTSCVNSKAIRRTGPAESGYDYSSMLDANGDGIINAKDYALIKRCVKKQNELIEIESQRLRYAINVNSIAYEFTIENNETAKAFVAKLPMTVELADDGDNRKSFELSEQIASNPQRLAVIRKGDILLSGDNKVVIFLGNSISSDEYTRIGSIVNTEGIETAFAGEAVSADLYTYLPE